MNQSSLYDIEAEEDTIYILRAQNKKIKELYQDIENKDQIIYNLQNDTSQYEEYQRQISNYKNQIYSREEKIKVLENSLQETNKTTNDHLKKAAEVEHILRNQINSKEKVLSELNETIKQYESQSNKIKNELGEKSLTITKLKNNIDDLNTLNKNYVLKISLADEEIKSLKNENENISKDLYGNKMKFEDKTDELIDLITQQNYELNLFTINFKKIEKENLQFKSINTNYKNEIESLIDNINQIKENIEKLSKIEDRVKESEIMISDLQSIIESERNKNIEIQKKLIEANEKNNHLLIKSEENENLIQLLKNKDEDINNMQNQSEMISNVIKEKDLKIKQIENEIIKFSNYICDYLITATQWVDTYLGVYINFNFHSKNHFNFEIPELIFEKLNFNDDHATMMVYENNYSQCNSLNMNNNSFSNSNFFDLFKLNLLIEKFSNILMITRSKINEEFNNYDDTVTESQNFNSNLSLTNDELNKENSQLKKENSELNDYLNSEKDSNKKLKLEIKSLKEILDSVEQNRTELQKSNNKFLEMFLKDFQEVEKFIKNLPQCYHFDEFVSKHTLNENIKDRLKDYLENFFQILKNILADLDSTKKKVEEIQKIKIECENLKHQCENLKKEKSEEKQNILKEKNAQISNLEKIKVTQLNKVEEEYKAKLEQIKFELNDKIENNEKLKNEAELIRSQIELTEKNFENYKIIKKEQEYYNNLNFIRNFRHNLIEKYEKLIEDNKALEKTISDMNVENEIKNISYMEKSEKIQEKGKIRYNFDNNNTLITNDLEERIIK